MVAVRDNNTDYVLWKKSGVFSPTIIMATSTDRAFIDNSTNITDEDMKGTIAEEASCIVNLLVVSVGARLFNTFIN